MGWLWRRAKAHLYRGEQLVAGVKIYLLGSRNEGICECGENYEITEGKVLEYMRELTGHEAVDSGAGRSGGGTDRSHMVSSHGVFSHDGF